MLLLCPQVQHASGSLDSRGIIPWQHVGNGTKAADPHPERIARPWDSPDVELTFKPKISAKSQQLMAETRGSEGTGSFLDRLDNDMRRREAKQKVRAVALCCGITSCKPVHCWQQAGNSLHAE